MRSHLWIMAVLPLILAGGTARATIIAGAYPSRTVALRAPSTQEEDIVQRVNLARHRRGLCELEWDGRLSLVAREHSEDMATHGYFDYTSPRLGTLQYRLHRAGSPAANARFAIFRNNSLDTLMDQLNEGDTPPIYGKATRIGLGIHRKTLLGELHVTLILAETHTTLAPFPTLPIYGESYRLNGRLDAGFTKPKVIITLPDGTVSEKALKTSQDNAFSAVIDFNKGRGKYVVEVVAEGTLGPMVMDLMNCYVGVAYPSPDGNAPDGETPDDLGRAEVDMLRLINADRRKAGLKPLVFDERLASVARLHSADMVRNNFFAHKSPRQGDLSARMKRGGLTALRFTENLAANRTLEGAHVGLMNSPGHRANILDPLVDRVGVGIVKNGDEGIMVTQNYAQDFIAYDTESMAKDFVRAINAKRKEARSETLMVDYKLTRIALANSRQMQEKGKLNYDEARKRLREARLPYAIEMSVLRSVAPPSPEQCAKALGAQYGRIGCGIVQSETVEGEKFLWTTLLFAK